MKNLVFLSVASMIAGAVLGCGAADDTSSAGNDDQTEQEPTPLFSVNGRIIAVDEGDSPPSSGEVHCLWQYQTETDGEAWYIFGSGTSEGGSFELPFYSDLPEEVRNGDGYSIALTMLYPSNTNIPEGPVTDDYVFDAVIGSTADTQGELFLVWLPDPVTSETSEEFPGFPPGYSCASAEGAGWTLVDCSEMVIELE